MPDWVRAIPGAVASAPPKSLMNSRRLMHRPKAVVGQGITLARGRNVRFGSEADIHRRLTDVRFTPESGHSSAQLSCPLCAKSGHSRHCHAAVLTKRNTCSSPSRCECVPDRRADIQLRQSAYNEPVDRVLQSEMLPELNPFMNQRLRCADVPCVKASGTT